MQCSTTSKVRSKALGTRLLKTEMEATSSSLTVLISPAQSSVKSQTQPRLSQLKVLDIPFLDY